MFVPTVTKTCLSKALDVWMIPIDFDVSSSKVKVTGTNSVNTLSAKLHNKISTKSAVATTISIR